MKKLESSMNVTTLSTSLPYEELNEKKNKENAPLSNEKTYTGLKLVPAGKPRPPARQQVMKLITKNTFFYKSILLRKY